MSKNVNKAKINVEFNEATTRENLVSGESINTLFGKIKKFLSDLHDSAFTGNAAKVNNHTVNTDVPSDAVFTDTVEYKDISGSPITLDDACDAPLINLNIYGKSTQDGTPTPDAPVEIVSVGDIGSLSVQSCGKNLYEGSQDWSGTWINDSYWETVEEKYLGLDVKKKSVVWMGLKKRVYVEKGKTYTFSCYAKADVDISCRIFFLASADKSNESALPLNYTELFNVGTEWARYQASYACERTGYIFPRIEKAVEDSNYLYVCGYQLEESKTMTDYAPYKGSTATITSALPLCGIPVDSGGNYTDSNGQQWVCDYVDFARGVKVQKLEKVDLSELSWTLTNNDNYKYWISYSIKDGKKVESYDVINNILAEKYIAGSWSKCVIKENFVKNQIAYTYPDGHAMACQNGSETEKPSGKFMYELATPIETPLSEAELQAYRQLQTYNGVTNISNDGIADMYVKYWRDETIPSLINNTKYDDATTTKSGLMSAADKKKLDELSGGGSGGSSSSTRKSIVIDIDNTTTIDIPFTINDTKNLVVYLNGILLVPSIHYTATTSQITLTGYAAMSGDIVTFVGNDNVSTSVDILATEVGIQDTANNFPDANSVENALIQLANNAKELTNANKTNVKLNTDNAMTAKLIAQSNTDYAIKQVRNIIIIPKSQADNLPQGEPGDICIVYNDE